ncbi:hypothetical protein LEP1GSC202_0740 [Leptospira yanagawae serovar Saopaulo str. Sao Paulo = ATCC 700523]|uniref:Uncharacterized protein n=1 Tax=Leptospira yanagawae serovar Saopaulo str. Sao Paulo = ATCC 700523 TaxID=1249483 RepID=A0A5E8HDU2_9LEPT|nr:hypothetical protein LEP1GSC202_0740 [Leptospira yanagawae serovar Saopaulo str. Sao Paulo = ATCC 700523]
MQFRFSKTNDLHLVQVMEKAGFVLTIKDWFGTIPSPLRGKE